MVVVEEEEEAAVDFAQDQELVAAVVASQNLATDIAATLHIALTILE